MKCPNDNETLVLSERSNIEIDYCPTCRGVWLDRGELDKIIERASDAHGASAPARPIATPQVENIQHAPKEYRYMDEYRGDSHYNKKHKKKESFLGDLFDF